MHKYDALRNTWIYQEIKEQVQEEEYQQHLEEQRQILLEIVQARFPRMRTQARQLVGQITKLTTLQEFIVKIGTAHGEKQARQGFSEMNDQLKKEE